MSRSKARSKAQRSQETSRLKIPVCNNRVYVWIAHYLHHMLPCPNSIPWWNHIVSFLSIRSSTHTQPFQLMNQFSGIDPKFRNYDFLGNLHKIGTMEGCWVLGWWDCYMLCSHDGQHSCFVGSYYPAFSRPDHVLTEFLKVLRGHESKVAGSWVFILRKVVISSVSTDPHLIFGCLWTFSSHKTSPSAVIGVCMSPMSHAQAVVCWLPCPISRGYPR